MSSPPSPAKYPRPCIAELLRTRYYPPSLIFRVERIIEEACSSDQDHQHTQRPDKTRKLVGYRLLLSDGELMINATAKHVLHRLIRNDSVGPGSLIEVTKYGLRKAKRLNGHGNVLYLGIEDFQPLPEQGIEWHHMEDSNAHESVLGKRRRDTPFPSNSLQKMKYQSSLQEESFSSAGLDEALLSVTARKDEGSQSGVSRKFDDNAPKRKRMASQSYESNIDDLHKRQCSPGPRSCADYKPSAAEAEEDEDSDGFETASLDPALVKRRRQALSQVSGNIRSSVARNGSPLSSRPTKSEASLGLSKDRLDSLPRAESPTENSCPQDTVGDHAASHTGPLEGTEHASTLAAAPIHTLVSLLKPSPPLPQKTYRCTIFGLVSWVSPTVIKKPGFPLKRHIKIHDQTIGNRYSGVSISIFRDAQSFVPNVGTIALFRGLTAQWWENEVILNAYERDCRDDGWVLWDESLLEANGYDVHGLKTWWERRRQRQRRK
ncbi:MAG: hypothetical protein Q9160_005396 [Pyrenula sp. 1 TL-2023]